MGLGWECKSGITRHEKWWLNRKIVQGSIFPMVYGLLQINYSLCRKKVWGQLSYVSLMRFKKQVSRDFVVKISCSQFVWCVDIGISSKIATINSFPFVFFFFFCSRRNSVSGNRNSIPMPNQNFVKVEMTDLDNNYYLSR